MRINLSLFLTIAILFGSSCNIIANTAERLILFPEDSSGATGGCKPLDIMDILRKNKPVKSKPEKKISVIALPYVGYEPVTGFQIGFGSKLSWHAGHQKTSKLSAASIDLSFTTKHQLIFQARNSIFLDRDRWLLQGDWRYYLFDLPTYGLGTGNEFVVPDVPALHVNPENNEEFGGVYPMQFNWIKFHQTVSREIFNDLYAGMGFHLDIYDRIHDEVLNLDTSNLVITPHYAYCRIHGFDPVHYASSGLSANFVYDTRDHIINPYKGFYVNVNYRYNFTFLGSAQNGSQLWTEFRTYIGLSKKIPRHLFAFWLFGSYFISGEIPYLDLMSTGFDQANSSGRGYIQGRWRGESFIYGEVEYRFPISLCTEIVGGVLFFNLTTASNIDRNIPLFAYLKPAGGVGLRIMINKLNRTNILIDFAVGEMSEGFYLQAQEIF